MQGLAAANAKSATPFTTAGRVEQVGTWWRGYCDHFFACEGNARHERAYIGMEKFALTNLINTNKPKERPSSLANGIRQCDAWKRRDGSCWPPALDRLRQLPERNGLNAMPQQAVRARNAAALQASYSLEMSLPV
jgi:hypothetical protein